MIVKRRRRGSCDVNCEIIGGPLTIQGRVADGDRAPASNSRSESPLNGVQQLICGSLSDTGLARRLLPASRASIIEQAIYKFG